GRSEPVVAIEQAAEPAQPRAVAAVLAAGLWRGREHAPGQARERQRLQPHLARPGQGGQEHALAAEQHALDAADRTHVHAHAGVVADHAAGIHVDALARAQFALAHAAASGDEHPAVAFEPPHDEALAAAPAGEDAALEGHPRPHAT